MSEIYDVAIVGTGSVGSAAGYYAANYGQSVLELDIETPPHELGSHHGQSRIIRHAYGEGAKYVPLVLKAQHLFEELQKSTELDLFHQTGVLNVGPRKAEFITNVLKSAHDFNLPIEELDNQKIEQKFSDWHFDNDYIGVLEKNSGYLKSENIIHEYIRLAKENSVKQEFASKVQSIKQVDDVVEIKTADQTFVAKSVIVTAGTWVKELLPDLPVQPVRKVFTWFKAEDEHLNEANGFPCFAVETKKQETYYGFPATDGLIKIGHHDGGQEINQRQQRGYFGDYASDQKEVQELLQEHLKHVGAIDHGGSCTYDLSPDEDFIIDYVPNQPKIQFVTGLSGHGFKFSSVLGQIVARRSVGLPDEFDLTPFQLDRFKI